MAARAFLLWATLVLTSDLISLRTFCKLKFSWRFGVGRCLILHELSFLPSHFSFSFVTIQLYEELKIFSFCLVKKRPYKPTPTCSKHQVLKLDHWNGVAKSPSLNYYFQCYKVHHLSVWQKIWLQKKSSHVWLPKSDYTQVIYMRGKSKGCAWFWFQI